MSADMRGPFSSSGIADELRSADPSCGVEECWRSTIHDAARERVAIAEGATAEQAVARAVQIARALNVARYNDLLARRARRRRPDASPAEALADLQRRRTAEEADEWTTRARLYQVLDAGSDRNGNPRRRTVFYGPGGEVVAVVDLGYAGLPVWARGKLIQLPGVSCSASELRAFDDVDPREGVSR